ncbi:hypothetical protein [Methylocystis parvus]|uniref:DUF2267 domain-containing protein n=1 Tax=Methylocystis parvus TaxID=134 RepID=A0A6B8M628_9HYPH|nr:hypothetical protein [Methylocystis parvus]QGM96280.1 DUF2267 domain-containing protein [Methylocystis parvus]WBJ99884.1 DUF2267 domain-containing protein [Methylocystis parvus OBBP]
MDPWIAHIAHSVGTSPAVARLAVGHVFGFLLKRHPDQANELIDKIPGSRQAVADAAAAPRKKSLLGGVLGGVGGMMGGSKGDMLALTSDLTALGLSADQLKRLAHEIFGGAALVIGKDKLRVMTDPIPGLSGFLWPNG